MKLLLKNPRYCYLRWYNFLWLTFLLNWYSSIAQTTTEPPSTTSTGITENTNTIATTFPPTSTVEEESTTLTVADSAVSTTTVATESTAAEAATTEGQASNDDLRARGFGSFESQRNRPTANLEVAPNQGSTDGSKSKNEEKNSAWKFTRGGNNQDTWSTRPSSNSGYPQWKKTQTPSNVSPGPEPVQSKESEKDKKNDQPSYIVWNAGTGNDQNGWNLDAVAGGWVSANAAPGSEIWNSADSGSADVNSGAWDVGTWTDDQASSIGDSQGDWQNDESLPNVNEQNGWNNLPSGAWTAPAGEWSNSAQDSSNGNDHPNNAWAPQNEQSSLNSGAPSPNSNDWTSSNQNAPNTNEWATPNQQPLPPGGWVSPNQNPQAQTGWTSSNPNSLPQNGWTPQNKNSPNTNGWSPQNKNPPAQYKWTPQNQNTPDTSGWSSGNQNPPAQTGWISHSQNAPNSNGWSSQNQNAPSQNHHAPSQNHNAPSQNHNVPPQIQNAPSQNGWAPKNENSKLNGGWTSQNKNPSPSNGWKAPVSNNPVSNQWVPPNASPTVSNHPSNAWSSQSTGIQTSPQQGNNSWKKTSSQTGQQQQTNSQVGKNSSWNQNNVGGWVGPKPAVPQTSNAGSWKSANGGAGNAYGNKQTNIESYYGGTTNSGNQDQVMSWKVYNEDTQTMENLDDNLGWKVEDDGSNGWKLVDENGNIEWKIENVNGEWKVTSADELSKSGNSTSNITDATSTTSSNITNTSSTTSSPTGGWDDDKQGRYIVWKFSEDGKGVAQVYNGNKTEPDVWTVGDADQFWKETAKANTPKSNTQGSWSSNQNTNINNKWNNDRNSGVSKQNVQQPQTNSWRNGKSNVAQQNNKWKGPRNNKPTQANNGGWQTGNNGNAKWQQGTNNSPHSGVPTAQGWLNSNNGAQKPNGPPASQTTTWNNNGNTPTVSGSWQGPSQGQGNIWNSGNGAPKPAHGNRQSITGNHQTSWQPGGTSNQANSGTNIAANNQRSRGNSKHKNRGVVNGWVSNTNNNKNSGTAGVSWNNANAGNSWGPNTQSNIPSPPSSWNQQSVTASPIPSTNKVNDILSGWNINNNEGQAVPYVIIIKTPQVITSSGEIPNSWTPNNNNKKRDKSANNNKPQTSRRDNNGYKMNRAGSSGWQWNPQGNSNGWKWNDGWMGSGGGFGGWVNDGNTMYSGWKPTKNSDGVSRAGNVPANKRSGITVNGNKKNGNKMVFVFGTKKGSKSNNKQTANRRVGKGKQVIIIDYTTGKKIPKTDESMKRDIETVIQALKSAKPTGIRGSISLNPSSQTQNQQKWSA